MASAHTGSVRPRHGPFDTVCSVLSELVLPQCGWTVGGRTGPPPSPSGFRFEHPPDAPLGSFVGPDSAPRPFSLTSLETDSKNLSNSIRLRLQPLSGPPLAPIEVQPGVTTVLGRGVDGGAVLPHEAVSKRHAELAPSADTASWRITDLASRHGTFLNEVRLRPNQPIPLRIGDVIRIRPWALLVVSAEAIGTSTAIRSAEDPPESTVRELGAGSLGSGDRIVRGLVQAASTLSSTDSEAELANALVRDAVRLTGFARGALIRPQGPDTLEIIAAHDSTDESAPSFRFSRSLVRMAMQGRGCALTQMPRYTEDSVAELGIVGAVCAPLMVGAVSGVGGVPTAALYLDSRSGEPRPTGSAELLTVALAEIASPSFARVRTRSVLERLQHLERDLNAAAIVQRAMLPSPIGMTRSVRFAMRSKPGRSLSGDLFDILELEDGRTLVWLGDVAGKGAPAAMMMATVQGGLRTAVGCGVDPFEALRQIGSEISRISDSSSFVTMMLLEIAGDGRRVRVADLGHGLGAILHPGRPGKPIQIDGCPPLGVEFDLPMGICEFTLEDGECILLISDGVIDQPGVGGSRFSFDRAIASATGESPAGRVDALMWSLTDHMGTLDQFDDMTVAVIAPVEG
jgi:phosphoserine phosphatase RsbU/P